MKRLIPLALAAAITLPAYALFAAEQAPGKDRKSAVAPSGMGMTDMQKQMAQMQENMEKMHQQMDQIYKTTDPQELQKLMQEHMQTMQENMQMMRGMGCPMMGMMGMMGGDANQRMGMMQHRGMAQQMPAK